MQILPTFTEEQQAFVIENLKQRTPHKRIAKAFQQLYPDFGAEVDQKTFEKAFTKRTGDYVSNKSRKWAKIIKEGRKLYDNLEEDSLCYPLEHYRTARREALAEQIQDLVVRIQYSDIDDEKKFKLELMCIKMEMQLLNDYEKSERAARAENGDARETTPVLDPWAGQRKMWEEDDSPTEEDFNYEKKVA